MHTFHSTHAVELRYYRSFKFSNGGTVYKIDIRHDDPRGDQLDERFPDWSNSIRDVRLVSDADAMELHLLYDCEPVDPKDA